jgi:transcriptional regulator with XRE-family HTH domain
VNQDRKDEETSFGASLYRLRKQKKLKRSDFAPLSAKTVARIERNEIGRPHGKTLKVIADRLSVLPEELGTF